MINTQKEKNIFITHEWVSLIKNQSKYAAKVVEIIIENESYYILEFKIYIFKIWKVYGVMENLKELFDRAKEKKVTLVECNFNMSRYLDLQMLNDNGCLITLNFGSHVLDLSKTEDELWNLVHSKHRNVIRKAEKERVIVKEELNLQEFNALLEVVYEKGGNSSHWSIDYLDDLRKTFSNNLLLVGSFYEDVLQAGAVIIFDQSNAYYLHGAVSSSAISGSSNLLQWEIIKKLKRAGLNKYDFGGARLDTADTRLQGIFKFKERFGGIYTNCYYWEKGIINYKYFFYKILKKLR